jgi:hypothetical protein
MRFDQPATIAMTMIAAVLGAFSSSLTSAELRLASECPSNQFRAEPVSQTLNARATLAKSPW